METSKIKNFYRHGDISLHEINELPNDLIEIQHNGNYVLAYGEATNHKHVARVANPPSMKVLKDKDGKIYLSFSEDAKIVHEEHKELTIKKGFYVIEHEREFDYWKNSVIKVQD